MNLLIAGSGSQARYVIDIARETRGVKVAGLLDIESSSRIGLRMNNVPIIGTPERIPSKYSPKNCRMIVATGDARRKKEIVSALKRKGYSFWSAISRCAYISPEARVGTGVILNPGSIIMPNARIGDHVILHSACVVEHDNVIGSFANLAPGVTLAGRVKVGEGAVLFTGATVIPDIPIGAWSVVAAGAVVTRPVAAGIRVAGVPARPMKK